MNTCFHQKIIQNSLKHKHVDKLIKNINSLILIDEND